MLKRKEKRKHLGNIGLTFNFTLDIQGVFDMNGGIHKKIS